MFKKKSGIVESGVLFALITILSTVASTGTLFGGGGNPVGSMFIVGSSALVAYSQSPDVKNNFRRDKAVGMCKLTGNIDCETMVQSWNDDDVLDYIRDDEPGTGVQWSDMLPRLGG